MKKALKSIGLLLLIILLLFTAFISYITISDYKPLAVEILKPYDSIHYGNPVSDTTFTIITWNIGYAGLGKEMDFFYDGGIHVRTSPEATTKHLKNILRFLRDNDSIGFWLIQEVDVKAHRTYKINEVARLKQDLPEYESVFVTNYLVPFVPVPITEPMGAVHSGMMTLSGFQTTESIRYAYPLIASWPDRLFLLDRCFIFNRYRLSNGHDLCVMNTHNSAYVYDSVLRIEELQILKNVMLNEYQKGNYVVAGGDWNMNPPGFNPVSKPLDHRLEYSSVKMATDFLPIGWKCAFDPHIPTNRNNDLPYVKGRNGTSIIDFFVVSPNIQIDTVEVIDLNFQDSDHNPVFLRFSIKP